MDVDDQSPEGPLAERIEREGIVDQQAVLLDTEPLVEVTFRTSPGEDHDAVHLVGEFNEWSSTATPMRRADDGTYEATIALEPGRSYRYKFVVDGSWQNDPAADEYAANPYGGDDSVRHVGG